MNHIVLLNKIKVLLAENCEGTLPFEGLDGPIGLSLSQICDELYDEDSDDIEFLLNLETQTFYYDHKIKTWKMFPKIVDAITRDMRTRKMMIKQVWNNTNISKFVSYSDFYQILYLRKVDFEPTLERCIKIGSCDPKTLRLPEDEIWNTIIFASDKEFDARFNLMRMNAPSILQDLNIFLITLRACASAENPIENDEDYDEYDIEEDVDDTTQDEYQEPINNYTYDDRNYADGLDTTDWNLESILRQEGYTVSQKEALSDGERQNILKSVLLRGLMTKWDIIEHIELQISLRKNNSIYNTAILKWERDLQYIRANF